MQRKSRKSMKIFEFEARILNVILKKIVFIHNRTNIWMNKNNNILQLLTCTTAYMCPKRRLYPTFFNTLLQNKHFATFLFFSCRRRRFNLFNGIYGSPKWDFIFPRLFLVGIDDIVYLTTFTFKTNISGTELWKNEGIYSSTRPPFWHVIY